MTKKTKPQMSEALKAYWANSASQALIDAYRSGNFTTIRVPTKKS